MVITTTPDIPGAEITEILGIVAGNTVRTRNVGRDFMASFRNMLGGEIKTYTDMLSQARDEAYNRMVNAALQKGADAVVQMRFVTSEVAPGTAEMVAYGTAVKLKQGHAGHAPPVAHAQASPDPDPEAIMSGDGGAPQQHHTPAPTPESQPTHQ